MSRRLWTSVLGVVALGACGGRSSLSAGLKELTAGAGGAPGGKASPAGAPLAGRETSGASSGATTVGGATSGGVTGQGGATTSSGANGTDASAAGEAGASEMEVELPRFEALQYDELPTSTQATAVSADGKVVVGYMYYRQEAFRWTHATGLVPLGFLPPGDFGSSALAVNRDGSVIVGSASLHPCEGCTWLTHPFRWRGAELEDLGNLAGHPNGYACGITADGSAIVGYSSSNLGEHGFRWTQQSGLVPFGSGTPLAISGDGRVVVGYTIINDHLLAARLFEDGSITLLGTLPGHESSIADATNADGSVIVGRSKHEGLGSAFRWTEATGMVDLGRLDGDGWSAAHGASRDGTVIVGQSSEFESGAGSQGHAVVWDEAHGIRRLDSILRDLRVDFGDFVFTNASGVSADGRVVVGWGHGALGVQAFVVRLP